MEGETRSSAVPEAATSGAWWRPLDAAELQHAAEPGAVVAQLLHIAGTFSEAQLRGALARLARRHPRLLARIATTPEGPRWAPSGRDIVPLRAVAAATLRVAERVFRCALQQPLDPGRGPLYRLAWIVGAREQALIGVLHRSLADSASAQTLAVELATALQATQLGCAFDDAPRAWPSLDAASPAVTPWPVRLRQQWSRTRHRLAQPLVHLGTLERRSGADRRSHGVLLLSVPELVVTALRQRARAEGLTLDGVLAAALLRAVERCCGTRGPVPLATSLRGGASSRDEAAVGCFVRRVLTAHDGATSFWSLVREYADAVRVARADEGAAPLSLCCTGRLAQPPLAGALRLARCFVAATEPVSSGASLQLSYGEIGGAWHCALVYVSPVVGEPMARAIMIELANELERAF